MLSLIGTDALTGQLGSQPCWRTPLGVEGERLPDQGLGPQTEPARPLGLKTHTALPYLVNVTS